MFTDLIGAIGITDEDIDMIRIPDDIKDSVKGTSVDFMLSNVAFIFGVIFIVIIIVIWVMVPLKVMSWGIALLMTIVIGFILFISCLLYSNILSSEIDSVMSEIDDHISNFLKVRLGPYIKDTERFIDLDNIKFD